MEQPRFNSDHPRPVQSAMDSACLATLPVSAQTIVDEWATVKAPPAPELKLVQIDPSSAALLVLDFVSPNCTTRPRCMASVPAVKHLLGEARAKGMLIVFATGPTGKRADIVPELSPNDNEPVVSTGVDKYANTELEKSSRVAARKRSSPSARRHRARCFIPPAPLRYAA